jgi:hypothetical protein
MASAPYSSESRGATHARDWWGYRPSRRSWALWSGYLFADRIGLLGESNGDDESRVGAHCQIALSATDTKSFVASGSIISLIRYTVTARRRISFRASRTVEKNSSRSAQRTTRGRLGRPVAGVGEDRQISQRKRLRTGLDALCVGEGSGMRTEWGGAVAITPQCSRPQVPGRVPRARRVDRVDLLGRPGVRCEDACFGHRRGRHVNPGVRAGRRGRTTHWTWRPR